MSIEYFSMGLNQLDSKKSIRRMKTDAESKDCIPSLNDETIN